MPVPGKGHEEVGYQQKADRAHQDGSFKWIKAP
jgi:hypothetical protein